VADFLLQTKKWIKDRKEKHFLSQYLYYHSFIAGITTWVLLGWSYWGVALAIFITHTLIDGWKSYKNDTAKYFLIDQSLHVLVIILCWWSTFYKINDIGLNWDELNRNPSFWVLTTGFFFLTWPSGYLIGYLTKKWNNDLNKAESLVNAGMWIGIIERILILILVVKSQYEALGLLIAAKSIIRFSEKDITERRTEYLLIGTLISILIAVIIGLFIKVIIL